MSKIDRTQTSFGALFGIKARKPRKNLTFSNIASLSGRPCSELASDGGHFISLSTPDPLGCPPRRWSPLLAPRSALPAFCVGLSLPPASLSPSHQDDLFSCHRCLLAWGSLIPRSISKEAKADPPPQGLGVGGRDTLQFLSQPPSLLSDLVVGF